MELRVGATLTKQRIWILLVSLVIEWDMIAESSLNLMRFRVVMTSGTKKSFNLGSNKVKRANRNDFTPNLVPIAATAVSVLGSLQQLLIPKHVSIVLRPGLKILIKNKKENNMLLVLTIKLDHGTIASNTGMLVVHFSMTSIKKNIKVVNTGSHSFGKLRHWWLRFVGKDSGHDLLYIACRHHIFEVDLKVLFKITVTLFCGPKIALFKPFRDFWKYIDVSSYTSSVENYHAT